MEEAWDEPLAELHIGTDGKIRVFGLNESLMEVLSVVSGGDETIERRRNLAKTTGTKANERADQNEPSVILFGENRSVD